MTGPHVFSAPVEPGSPPEVETVLDAEHLPAARRRLRALRRFVRHRLAVAGGAVLGLVVLVSLSAPVLAPYPPGAIDLRQLAAPPPSAAHWLGTTDVGQDVLSRLLVGRRLSLLIGVTAALLSLLIGVAVGAVAGWSGRWLDTVLMRFVDVMLSVPALFLLLIFFSLTPSSVSVMIVFLGLFGWMYLARVVRAEVLALKERDYVASARAQGVGGWCLLWRHLLPNERADVGQHVERG